MIVIAAVSAVAIGLALRAWRLRVRRIDDDIEAFRRAMDAIGSSEPKSGDGDGANGS